MKAEVERRILATRSGYMKEYDKKDRRERHICVCDEFLIDCPPHVDLAFDLDQ